MKKNTQWIYISILAVIILAACFFPMFSPYGYETTSENQFQPPSWSHWMGTDIHGRDVLTRILYGARISLLIGFIGSSVSLVIGVVYGIVSGYVGGKVDAWMMRFVDILYSLPRIVIVIVLIAVLDDKVKGMLLGWFPGQEDIVRYSRLILLFAGLGFIQWLTMARIIRGEVLVLKEKQFIQASHVLGKSNFRIMYEHLLPNLSGVIIVYMTLTIPTVILEESFLSFLGLGVQAPLSSWGTLLSDGAKFINPLKIYWWLIVGPGIVMGLTLMCLNFLGDDLRDRFDPRMRSR
jgi:peptide/nickel transport system permease protein/oligopeptide transport system permease protein